MNSVQIFTIGSPQEPNDLYILLCQFIDSVIDGFTYFGDSTAEDDITSDISRYLDGKIEESIQPIFKFSNQARPADIGVFIGRQYSSYNARKFCWIEAKRLPTPNSVVRDEREYVFVDHSQNRFEGNGGIERFKLNKHGEGLPVAIMFGYVQSNTFEYWEEKVNQWLQTYSSMVPSYSDEKLERIGPNANRFLSTHQRIDHKNKQRMQDITIYHFWIAI
jgi:hypothetical protein